MRWIVLATLMGVLASCSRRLPDGAQVVISVPEEQVNRPFCVRFTGHKSWARNQRVDLRIDETGCATNTVMKDPFELGWTAGQVVAYVGGVQCDVYFAGLDAGKPDGRYLTLARSRSSDDPRGTTWWVVRDP
jgi:hypothetical protein